jgi:MFS family permease
MSNEPHYIYCIGRLRKDEIFKDIRSELNEDGRETIFSILSLRFWCHVNVSFPIIFLILYDIFNRDELLSIFTYSSLAYVIGGILGGIYADKKGCKSAIRLGIIGMIVTLALYGVFTVYQILGNNVQTNAQTFVILLQIMVGSSLSFIDGADTRLLKKMARVQGLSNKHGDHLEAICTKLKYSGAAFASLIGCAIYLTAPLWLSNQNVNVRKFIASTIIFLVAAAGHLFALRQIRRVPLEPQSDEEETWSGTFLYALKKIHKDKVLAVWTLLVAVTEGWLLFFTFDLTRQTLVGLRTHADTNLLLLLFIAILYCLATLLATEGSSYFKKWYKKKTETEQTLKGNNFKGGSVWYSLKFRLSWAIAILLIMLGVFALHSIILKIFNISYEQQSHISYMFSLVPLFFYTIYQFIRGFAYPLLKATVDDLADERSIKNPTTILSLALVGGRPIVWVIARLLGA